MLTQREVRVRSEMSLTKLQGFHKQFPRVSNIVHGPISQAFVSRLEACMLNYNPKDYDVIDTDELDPYSNGTHPSDEVLYLLDDQYKPVTHCIDKCRQRRKYFFFGPLINVAETHGFVGMIKNGSTLFETMQFLGEEADRVRYVLSYSQEKEAVILYKIPKDVALRQWFNAEINIEAETYQKEVVLIDESASKA